MSKLTQPLLHHRISTKSWAMRGSVWFPFCPSWRSSSPYSFTPILYLFISSIFFVSLSKRKTLFNTSRMVLAFSRHRMLVRICSALTIFAPSPCLRQAYGLASECFAKLVFSPFSDQARSNNPFNRRKDILKMASPQNRGLFLFKMLILSKTPFLSANYYSTAAHNLFTTSLSNLTFYKGYDFTSFWKISWDTFWLCV